MISFFDHIAAKYLVRTLNSLRKINALIGEQLMIAFSTGIYYTIIAVFKKTNTKILQLDKNSIQ